MQSHATFLQTCSAVLFALAMFMCGLGPASAQSAATQLETNKAAVRRVVNEVQRDGDFLVFDQLF